MRRTILIALGTGLILGILGLVMVFGSALAQPIFQANGGSQVAQQDDIGSCHTEGGLTGSAGDHMLGPLANALGMTEAELRTDLDAGQSVKDIAEARGYDDGQLGAALNAAMRDAMQQHVQDGLLSQAQADEMLKHMDRMGHGHLTDMLDGQMPADMMSGQDHGGMMGQDHGTMMGGQSHEGMMGGQRPGSMMGGFAGGTGDDSGGNCHTYDILIGEAL